MSAGGLARLAVAVTALGISGCTLDRPEDPVVLTGSQLAALQDTAAGDVVAFRWVNGWHQIPVQVDERKTVDLADVYGPNPPEHVRRGAQATVYADPHTFTGGDGDPDVDADDELALMAKDLSVRKPGDAAPPPGVVPGSGVELRVRSSLRGEPKEAWAYLFERSGNLDPAAGRSYVNYDFRLLSGDYKSTFDVRVGAPNPEESTVTTRFYSARFPARWLVDELRVTAGSATGADLLDRPKIRFYPGECSTNEQKMSTGGGAFIANKSGPVRGIRSYIGASSGTLTQRDHIFYEQRQDVRSLLRVHPIPGIVDFLDYSSAAIGMTYRNNNRPGGVTIDGNPDPAAPGPLDWETVDGAPGGLSMVHRVVTDVPGLTLRSYYLDDATPDEPQCTGDAASIGASGPIVETPIPTTDPVYPPYSSVTGLRTIYFEEPGKADGPARAAQAASELEVSATALP